MALSITENTKLHCASISKRQELAN